MITKFILLRHCTGRSLSSGDALIVELGTSGFLARVLVNFFQQNMAAPTTRVAIIGGGEVGTTLALKLHECTGFEVTIGARDPARTLGRIADTIGTHNLVVPVVRIHEAVAPAQVVILACTGSHDDAGIEALAASLGDCATKVVLDATNPFSEFPEKSCRWGHIRSGGEVLAAALPSSAVYKAFNSVGVEHMKHPEGSALGGNGGEREREDMLVAGDPREPFLDVALAVVTAVGFIPRYVGPIRYARNLEAIAELWVHLAVPPVGETGVETWGRAWSFKVAGDTGPGYAAGVEPSATLVE